MREKARRHKVKKLDIASSWFNRNRLPAIYRRPELDFVNYLHVNDGCTGSRQSYISDKELAHCIAIIFISAGAFGAGIGQIVLILTGR